MLTPADDYPLHQSPEPIAFAGTDRNFYDRFFFNALAAGPSPFPPFPWQTAQSSM